MTGQEALAELRTKCSDLETGVARATERLQQALLDGECTENLRGRLRELMSDLATAQAEFRTQAEKLIDARQKRLEAEAGSYVKGIAHKLKVVLAGLAPPPSPLGNCSR